MPRLRVNFVSWGKQIWQALPACGARVILLAPLLFLYARSVAPYVCQAPSQVAFQLAAASGPLKVRGPPNPAPSATCQGTKSFRSWRGSSMGGAPVRVWLVLEGALEVGKPKENLLRHFGGSYLDTSSHKSQSWCPSGFARGIAMNSRRHWFRLVLFHFPGPSLVPKITYDQGVCRD